MNDRQAVEAWQRFAQSIQVDWKGERRSWAEHIDRRRGYGDEEVLIQPSIFPAFAKQFLGFEVGVNIAPEILGEEGKPDFRPADAGTHPFVFETKPTSARYDFAPFSAQIERYLVDGRPRIRTVVVTNLLSIQIFELTDEGDVETRYSIDLRALLSAEPEHAARTRDAHALVDFLSDFQFRELSFEQKLDRIREAEPWNRELEVTNPRWVSDQLDRVVEVLRRDCAEQIRTLPGILNDRTRISGRRRAAITDELRELEFRLGSDWEEAHQRDLDDYLEASYDSNAGKVLRQYEAHVAYFAATRLLVVRIWEDLGLIDELLRDGGFDEWMANFNDVVDDVVRRSFQLAEANYPTLYTTANNYTWFEPTREAQVDAIFDLSNTYLGEIESDVFGDVYERLLERVDRKNIGQFYTPRDIIRLIWDLIGIEDLVEQAENEGRETRVLDIATGSGGFLVEAARRLRERVEGQQAAGAAISRPEALNRVARGLIGVEIQRFPAYLAEVNLLVQVGFLLVKTGVARIPPVGVLCRDTMSLHEPIQLPDGRRADEGVPAIAEADEFRQEIVEEVKDVSASSFVFDVACGNPPYVGEKRAAPVLRQTRERYPYWEQFVGPHLDVLYWFLILGVAKLRAGGRFGFITTEYWLRSDGARPLREYLAKRCHIDRVLLFGDMKLFPDAPGQHSMVIVGTRVTPRDEEPEPFEAERPRVSVYDGKNLSVEDRGPVLDVLRGGGRALGVRSFEAPVSPNDLGGDSWAEVVLSPSQHERRQRVRATAEPLALHMEEGVIATPDKLKSNDADRLPQGELQRLGYPDERPGIFLLTQEERAGLGPLTDAEKAVLRPMINTRDIYPYAAVLDSEASTMVYLPRPPECAALDQQDAQQLDFPANMPTLERHLSRFRPILEFKVTEQYDEKRPWWSVHRARESTMARDSETGGGHWADYGVTRRWSGNLLTGLAPTGAVPASGLHTLYSDEPATAAYVVGLMLSTPVQELTDTLPPGELRQADLESLGLPLIPDAIQEVSEVVWRLADLVDVLVRTHGSRWPLLREQLREDLALGTLPTEAWIPDAGSSTSWGPIKNVQWIREVSEKGAEARPIVDVSIDRDLWGAAVVVRGSGTGELRISLEEEDPDVLSALVRSIEGAAALGRELREVPEILVPIDRAGLNALFEDDLAELEELVSQYHEGRLVIDRLVEALL